MNILHVHIFIVLSVTVLVLIKFNMTMSMFLTLFGMLSIQLYMVYYNYCVHVKEHFSDIPSLHNFDKQALEKLYTIPHDAQLLVSSGLDALIATTSSKTESTILSERNKNYEAESIRKEYKHIDYFLEKLHVFDANIYESLVPNFSKDDDQTMDMDNIK